MIRDNIQPEPQNDRRRLTNLSPKMLELSPSSITGQFKPAGWVNYRNIKARTQCKKQTPLFVLSKEAVTVLQPPLSEMCKKNNKKRKEKENLPTNLAHIPPCKWASSDQGSPFSESRNSAVHLSAWLCVSAGSLQAAKKNKTCFFTLPKIRDFSFYTGLLIETTERRQH